MTDSDSARRSVRRVEVDSRCRREARVEPWVSRRVAWARRREERDSVWEMGVLEGVGGWEVVVGRICDALK